MKEAFIDIHGPYSTIRGEFPLDEVMYETSYLQPGAQFSAAFKKRNWDGRINLFNKRSKSFPTGLLSTVVSSCENNGVKVTTVDHRHNPKIEADSFVLAKAPMTGKYAFQLDACKQAVEKKQGIIKVATGGGKGSIAVAITKFLGLQTLFVVPTRELMLQMQKRFMDLLDIQDPNIIGVIGDGEWEPGSWVTVALIDTLASRLENEECITFLSNIDVLFLDEAHRTGSESYFDVAMVCPAYYRIALSATPLDRSDGANLRVIAATGDVLVDIPNKMLVELGITAQADIIWDKIAEPILPKRGLTYGEIYKQGISENEHFHNNVVNWVKACRKQNLSVMIMVEEIKHGKAIDDLLWTNTDGEFIPHTFIHGNETPEVRDKALKDFSERNIPVLIISRIGDEGLDCHSIDVLMCCGSRKSKIRTLQRLGRGLRGENLIVIEWANYCHKYLISHSLTRLDDYKKEEIFPIHQYKQGTDKSLLLKKLWDGQTERNKVRLA